MGLAAAQPAALPPTPARSDRGTAAAQRRYRFRNLSGCAVKLQFYKTDDRQHRLTLPNGTKTIGAA